MDLVAPNGSLDDELDYEYDDDYEAREVNDFPRSSSPYTSSVDEFSYSDDEKYTQKKLRRNITHFNKVQSNSSNRRWKIHRNARGTLSRWHLRSFDYIFTVKKPVDDVLQSPSFKQQMVFARKHKSEKVEVDSNLTVSVENELYLIPIKQQPTICC